MAKMNSIKCVKKSAGMKSSHGKQKMGDFILFDNQDDTFTVAGADAGGNAVDLDPTQVTLTCKSSDESVVTVDPPAGMTVKAHALKPGSATLSFTATWGDGSVGPFSADFPLNISGTAPAGLIITPGTPVAR